MQPVSATQTPLDYTAAIFPARLEWLCQPEQIEHTLRLLYYLNFWKRARHHLLYVDRLGLFTVQFLILLHALKTGLVRATLYLDGTSHFPGELLLDSAAESAARSILAHVRGLTNPDIWPPFKREGDAIYQDYIRPLYRRVTGQDFKYTAQAIQAVELKDLRAYLQERLQGLVRHAQETRLPLSTRRLAALCLAPADLLPLSGNRHHFLETCANWKDLDSSDLRRLDPEGYSEIVLQYNSPQASFAFHLPYRQVEKCMLARELYELRRTPGTSQEHGIYQGQPIKDSESQAQPVREILQDLGVDISCVCPRGLLDRATFMATHTRRDLLSSASAEIEAADWPDDPWDYLSLPPDLL
ncbi:MAG TPA: hypothetical protein VHD63_20985 [Ktedonobacteraceae bacterium]|nr:hypothetical protein [Ktedonobacteraceae bacterium]